MKKKLLAIVVGPFVALGLLAQERTKLIPGDATERTARVADSHSTPTAVGVGSGEYFVQVESLLEERDVISLASYLHGIGSPKTVRSPARRNGLYTLLLGPYETRTEAKLESRRLMRHDRRHVFVLRIVDEASRKVLRRIASF